MAWQKGGFPQAGGFPQQDGFQQKGGFQQQGGYQPQGYQQQQQQQGWQQGGYQQSYGGGGGYGGGPPNMAAGGGYQQGGAYQTYAGGAYGAQPPYRGQAGPSHQNVHHGEPVNQSHNHGGTKLYVENLPNDIQRDALEMVFSTYGALQDIHVMTGRGNRDRAAAFIRYMNPTDASTSVAAMEQGYEIRPGQGNIVVRMAHDRPKQ